MNIKTLTLGDPYYPDSLRTISSPPSQLYCLGADLSELLKRPKVSIIGSRKVTNYGKEVTLKLARELAEQGVLIISGLALGVDALAHRGALEGGGVTLAVLPSPVERIYPATNRQLAWQMLEQGGAIISEYPAGTESFRNLFIERNRIVSGLADAVLITEAAEKSGTMHTARFALEQGKDVLAVPGNITSPLSAGTNNLIKSGATPVTCADDVLHVLGISRATEQKRQPKGATPEEDMLLALLFGGIQDGDKLLVKSELPIQQFNQTLTMLEITGKIRSLGVNHWSLY